MSNRAGFKSGLVYGERIAADGRIVPNKIVLQPEDFKLGLNMVSGTNALSGTLYTMGWTSSGVAGTGKYAQVQIVTPSNVSSNAKANLNLYFFAHSGVLGNTAEAIVFDADYRIVKVLTSGAVLISGTMARKFIISGAVSNVTKTYTLVSGVTTISGIGAGVGALQKVELGIPTGNVEGNALFVINLYRDAEDANDTWGGNADVAAVEIEFIEV